MTGRPKVAAASRKWAHSRRLESDWRVQRISLLDVCQDPDHEPACMLFRRPGTYEHVCPKCGAQTVFEIPRLALVR